MKRSLWLRLALGILAVFVLVVGTGVVYLRIADKATPVSVEESVDRYRGKNESSDRGTSSPAEPDIPVTEREQATPSATRSETGRSFPPAGVYVYETEGYESAHLVLSARHEYPEKTTVTLTREGCGQLARWQPLSQRLSEAQTCLGQQGEELRSVLASREFFGRRDSTEFLCSSGSLTRPYSVLTGFVWKVQCRSAESTILGSGKVLGTESVRVGEKMVRTARVRISQRHEGRTRGSSSFEDWVLPENGLVVRRVASVNAEGDTNFGTGTYREQYTLNLTSLEPVT